MTRPLLQIFDRILPKHPIWRFMVVHWLQGMLLGGAIAGGILYLDIGHIRTLISHSNVFWVASILLILAFSLSFGGLFCGSAIMRLGDKPKDDSVSGGKLMPVVANRRQSSAPSPLPFDDGL